MVRPAYLAGSGSSIWPGRAWRHGASARCQRGDQVPPEKGRCRPLRHASAGATPIRPVRASPAAGVWIEDGRRYSGRRRHREPGRRCHHREWPICGRTLARGYGGSARAARCRAAEGASPGWVRLRVEVARAMASPAIWETDSWPGPAEEEPATLVRHRHEERARTAPSGDGQPSGPRPALPFGTGQRASGSRVDEPAGRRPRSDRAA